jgi:hypothetical protein
MTTNSSREKDAQLAEYTDAILEGQAYPDADQLPSQEAEMVKMLARTVSQKPVPDSLRRELSRRISAEFSPKRPSIVQELLRSLSRPSHRRLWATAAIVALVAIAAVLLFPLDGSPITGTVTGEVGVIALVFGLVLIGAILIAWRVARH